MSELNSKIEFSIVIPAYKCEKCISELHSRLTGVLGKLGEYEIIFVNDASPENDWEIIRKLAEKDKRVKGINFSRNFGQHFAITAGIDHVCGNWLVVMDCDLQDRPEEIEKFYKKAIEGSDVVVGRRKERKDGLLKKVNSKLFFIVYNYFSGTNVNNSISSYGIYSRKVIENLKRLREQNRSFGLFVYWLGFKRIEIDIEHSQRTIGESSYSFSKLFRLAFDSIVSHSNKLLRLSIKFGLTLSLGAFLFGLWIIFKYFYFGIGVLGWTSMMVTLLFISGLLFANMGLLGLYIGKIFDEVKNRPLYVVDEFLNIDGENN
jgi:polyisoprenyl-phosphate glycosyltransferase